MDGNDGNCVESVVLQTVCFLNLQIIPYVFADLATNNIATCLFNVTHDQLRQMLSHPMATLSITQTANAMLFASLEGRGWTVGFELFPGADFFGEAGEASKFIS